MGIFIAASKVEREYTFKAALRHLLFALCRIKVMFMLLSGIYKMLLSVFVTCLRRICPDCSVYVKSGMALGEIYPASSDIDITVIIKDSLPEERVSEVERIVAVFRFFRKIFFVFCDTQIFTEKEIKKYIKGYGTGEYGRGVRPWRLVAGKERIDFRLLEKNDSRQPFIFLKPFALYSDVLLRDYFCGRNREHYFYREIFKTFLTVHKYGLFLRGHIPTTFQRYGQTFLYLRKFCGSDKRISVVLDRFSFLEKRGFMGRFDSEFLEEIITLFLSEENSLFKLINEGCGDAENRWTIITRREKKENESPVDVLLGDNETSGCLQDCEGVALLKDVYKEGHVMIVMINPVAEEQRFKERLKNIRRLYSEERLGRPLLNGYPFVVDSSALKIFMCLNPHLYLSLLNGSLFYPEAAFRDVLMGMGGLVKRAIRTKVPYWLYKPFTAFRDADLWALKGHIGVVMRMLLLIKHGVYIDKEEEAVSWLKGGLPELYRRYRIIVSIDCSASGSTRRKAMRDIMKLYYDMLPGLGQELYGSGTN